MHHSQKIATQTTTMKKKLLALAALIMSLLMGNISIAQETNTGATDSEKHPSRWSLGIIGGWEENTPVVNMPDYASTITYQPLSGATVGITSKYAITNWLYGRADLVWLQKNFKMNRSGFSAANIINSQYTNNYLTLPITAMMSFGYNFRINAFAGGYVGYWLNGHRTGKSFSWDYCLNGSTKYIDFDEEYTFNDERDNRFDAGLTFGGGISYIIAQKIEINLEARWYYGLTDIQKNYMTFMRHHYNTTMALQLGAYYKF